uniref:Uncharacterized protein n=1 Tax=Nelumbo nucifera TaxID=4432 RepID=A0A822Y965_NELNU|nr:TPA_asm: hypothetical protein HUJ06_030425 [Nelumbo nucifera]
MLGSDLGLMASFSLIFFSFLWFFLVQKSGKDPSLVWGVV